jgi:hypothetical protein
LPQEALIGFFWLMSLWQNPEFAQSDLDPERRLPAGLVAFPPGRLEAGAPQTLHGWKPALRKLSMTLDGRESARRKPQNARIFARGSVIYSYRHREGRSGATIRAAAPFPGTARQAERFVWIAVGLRPSP